MWSLRAKKVALYVAFIWMAYGFFAGMMANTGIEKALIKAVMPGGLLLLGAILAYSFPRVGSMLMIVFGVLMFVFVKQESVAKSLIVSIPPILIGLVLIFSEILDAKGK